MPSRVISFFASATLIAAAMLSSTQHVAAITLTSLASRTIVQRNNSDFATLPIGGAFAESATMIEARAIARSGFAGTTTDWQIVDASPSGGIYSGAITAAGGWYDVEVRARNGGVTLGSMSVERIGVGEVFITAGQSNSANEGAEGPLSPTDDRVSAYDPVNGWRQANDPQPVATGIRGSLWPRLGDQLAAKYDVPIGFYSVGWSGTAVEHWLPGAPPIGPAPLYNRLQSAVSHFGSDGVRALLWHQGETNNLFNTSTADYASRLKTVIDQSRLDAGFNLPWLVALASFFPGVNIDANVIAGQQQVIDNDPFTFLGPNTDTLVGSPWRDLDGAGVHFSTIGLTEHARLWAQAIENSKLIRDVPEPTALGLVLGVFLTILSFKNRRGGFPRRDLTAAGVELPVGLSTQSRDSRS